jgi:hypothetical protein
VNCCFCNHIVDQVLQLCPDCQSRLNRELDADPRFASLPPAVATLTAAVVRALRNASTRFQLPVIARLQAERAAQEQTS